MSTGSRKGEEVRSITALIFDLIEVMVQTESFKVLREQVIQWVFRSDGKFVGRKKYPFRKDAPSPDRQGTQRSPEDFTVSDESAWENDKLCKQIILSILGNDLSRFSGIDIPFHPEWLNEPFIKTSLKVEMVGRMENEILAEIKTAISHNSLSEYVIGFRRDTEAKLNELLKRDEEACAKFNLSTDARAGRLSSALGAVINRKRELITGQQQNSDSAASIGDTPTGLSSSSASGADSYSSSSSSTLPGKSSKSKEWPIFDLMSYKDVVGSLDPSDGNRICRAMHGDYLNSDLRRTLWMHRLLLCLGDNPNRDISFVSELQRVASSKRVPPILLEDASKANGSATGASSYHPSSFYTSSSSSSSSSTASHSSTSGAYYSSKLGASAWSKKGADILGVEELINRLLRHYIFLGLFKADSKDIKPDLVVDLSAHEVLLRRAKYLVYSFYVTSGQVTHRSVIASLLLLHVFPDLSPTCEITLRMQHRVILEILPSHLLAKSYCIQSVAAAAMAELLTEDRDLYFHIQRSNLSNPSFERDSTELHHHHHQQQESIATILLFGWIDSGFWGYFREHTVLYIWDFILTSGPPPTSSASDGPGSYTSVEPSSQENVPILAALSNIPAMQNLFSRLCCVLLKTLRAELLACSTQNSFLEALSRAGREVKTKTVVGAVKAAIASGYLHA